MAELRKENNGIFEEFFTGKNGNKTVNCVLDDNCVRYIVFERGKIKSIREFDNSQKNLCFKNATKALNG
jgi:hypothetical protein|nr:MAG TPA: hypothetical protein [Caudoviricetes sp.]